MSSIRTMGSADEFFETVSDPEESDDEPETEPTSTAVQKVALTIHRTVEEGVATVGTILREAVEREASRQDEEAARWAEERREAAVASLGPDASEDEIRRAVSAVQSEQAFLAEALAAQRRQQEQALQERIAASLAEELEREKRRVESQVRRAKLVVH